MKGIIDDKTFKKTLLTMLINDYLRGDQDLSLDYIKKKTEDLLEVVVDLESFESFEMEGLMNN